VAPGPRRDAATVLPTHDIPAPNATGVQIRAETAGNSGPPLADVGFAAGTAAPPIDVLLTGFDPFSQPLQFVSAFPESLDAFLTRRTYVDVETTSFPAGEIRGQFLPEVQTGAQSTGRVVPPSPRGKSEPASKGLQISLRCLASWSCLSALTTVRVNVILSQTGKGKAWRGGPVLLLP
jgi:hypothetical protein